MLYFININFCSKIKKNRAFFIFLKKRKRIKREKKKVSTSNVFCYPPCHKNHNYKENPFNNGFNHVEPPLINRITNLIFYLNPLHGLVHGYINGNSRDKQNTVYNLENLDFF